MPIYRDIPEPFECVICEGQFPRKWTDPAHRDIPPVCWSCEQMHGTGPYGQRKPDVRVAKQISALAGWIQHEAYRALHPEWWGHPNG